MGTGDGPAITMKLACDGGWRATVTDDPLHITPRFTGDASVDVARYADARERERFLADTFGSPERLWDAPDILRFDKDSRALAGAQFHWPEESASAEEAARLPLAPAVRPGGLRADTSASAGTLLNGGRRFPRALPGSGEPPQ
ncbi:hypothetical protein [Streptomyces sp. ISL-94]|uniref:hypothetical protein n=1 Tax=Streptomyces sp. ISL-94 TaxID=2819190 RepID=UPI001BE4E323|nr:hypothetical protein [Streptomyces sp. ISL-94]MBT2478153.1 hypothetical protein [Streptomyces sp. ISL-94]